MNHVVLQAKQEIGQPIGEETEWKELNMPSWISHSEKQQIKNKIPIFVQKITRNPVLWAHVQSLALSLKKPLRAMLFNPHSKIWNFQFELYHFCPIICISASRIQGDCDTDYLQGAGDDEESWSMGLTYKQFWGNVDEILDSGPSVEEVITKVIQRSKESNNTMVLTTTPLLNTEATNHPSTTDVTGTDIPQANVVVRDSANVVVSDSANVIVGTSPTNSILEMKNHFFYIGESNVALGDHPIGSTPDIFKIFDVVINCSSQPYPLIMSNKFYLHLPVAEGKGQKSQICNKLPEVLDFFQLFISWEDYKLTKNVLIHSLNDLNTTLSICLAIFISFYDTRGKLLVKPELKFSKDLIRTMYYYLSSFCTQARIQRVVMNDINRFFMSPLHGHITVQNYWRRRWKKEKDENT
eukprot:TRINITY_DN8350_c0_g1_i6.p1 TRINITY_DN8350_c0_g1~~TRINITY_DN8350_c0_g1_i6.p1  ORF type:complete len:410 (-),score=85.79 TRINITY_DN8350_c0_g1_i6:125-1354(-)